VDKEIKKVVFKIEGMDCADCTDTLKTTLNRLKGVKDTTVNFATAKAKITYDENIVSPSKIKQVIRKMGYRAKEHDNIDREHSIREECIEKILLVTVGVFVVLGWVGITLPYIPFNIAVIAIVIGMVPILKKAIYGILAKNINVQAFITIAVVGSCIIEEYLAGATVVFIMLIGEVLEDYTIEKSRKAIHDLIDLTPETATVKRNGREIEVPVEDVKIDEIVLSKTGGKIPVDGVVIYGKASVNQASITGESIPIEKKIGDTVFSGTTNESGYLEIKATKVGEDTTLGHIIQLVEKAQEAKAPIQRVADKFTNWFTPSILAISALTYIATNNPIYAITVLIIACPCSIALAAPTAIVAGIGIAAKKGIIIKGGTYLEGISKVDTVVFDKTGTLTIGKPKVVEVISFGMNEKDVVKYASIAEKFSEHPLSKAVIEKAAELKINMPDPEKFNVIVGAGVTATYHGNKILVGTRRLLTANKVKISKDIENLQDRKESEGETVLHVALGDAVIGLIVVADVLKENAKETIASLRKIGIKKIVMLTGDNAKTGLAIGSKVGITDVKTQLLPENKVENIEKLKKDGFKVAMVGDGVNDAPALATADIGIAMGAAGTDVAIETADIALMSDDLSTITDSIDLGRKTFGRIKQNLGISIVFNIVGIGLAASGYLSPIGAAVAHNIACVGVILNSVRLVRYVPKRS